MHQLSMWWGLPPLLGSGAGDLPGLSSLEDTERGSLGLCVQTCAHVCMRVCVHVCAPGSWGRFSCVRTPAYLCVCVCVCVSMPGGEKAHLEQG